MTSPATVPADANVLLLTIDTLRADHLGAYGYGRATSPAIDRVAADGTVFENAWAHAPSTRYSMPAILTGRLPLQVAYDTSIEGWPGLAPEAITIAEVLRTAGLVTGAITNYWYFDAHRGMDQGVDEYDNDNARLHAAVAGQGPAATRGSSSREQTDKALAFVDRHAQKRWFLWVHYYDPHYEYEPHPDSVGFGSSRVDRYDGEIRFTDDHVGRLIEDLRRRGLYDRTIIAITGDHGEGFGEHGVDLHGYHLYAPQTKVPLIVRVPGLPARRSTTVAGHVDLLPTLANLTGAAAPTASGAPHELLAAAMGQSLVEILAGGPERDRTLWQQLSYEGNHELRGAVTRECHVLYQASPATSWEAYRLDRDPQEEERDVAGSDECRQVRQELARWYDASGGPAAEAKVEILPARPDLTAPLLLELGSGVRLLELRAPAKVRAKDVVELRWTFESLAPMPAGWKVFVHVEGPSRFTGDHAPPRPLEWWQPGQFVQYSTTLRVPASAPAGSYTVWVGLWKGAARQPVRRSPGAPTLRIEQDRAAVATLELTP
ncbi:MAG: sulfatase [Myxococcales bacterium]|nr:sulfatase [Myxococcales bacterium]